MRSVAPSRVGWAAGSLTLATREEGPRWICTAGRLTGLLLGPVAGGGAPGGFENLKYGCPPRLPWRPSPPQADAAPQGGGLHAAERACADCGATETPQWRQGPMGEAPPLQCTAGHGPEGGEACLASGWRATGQAGGQWHWGVSWLHAPHPGSASVGLAAPPLTCRARSPAPRPRHSTCMRPRRARWRVAGPKTLCNACGIKRLRSMRRGAAVACTAAPAVHQPRPHRSTAHAVRGEVRPVPA